MRTAIGLEVHAQLRTRTKLFCGCSADYFGKPPNTLVCPVCLGMPGALPVLNREAVALTLRVGLALGCTLPEWAKFDRKNYFYPDLPKGYQISQYDKPFCLNGHLEFEHEGQSRRVRIRRVHLEEDAGKLVHAPGGRSLVDLNRAGVPLLEIVTEPDLDAPEAAAAFLRALRRLLRYLEVCDGDMEKGSLRCDANLSVSPDPERLGTKTEVKNMNSFKAVEEALRCEQARQRALLEAGAVVVQETLGWDAEAGRVVPQRGKEEAEDYRYFPEPDLPRVRVAADWVEAIRAAMPETPERKRAKFRGYGLPAADVAVLVEERELAEFFEATLTHFDRPQEVSNWIRGELLRRIKDHGALRVRPEAFAELLALVERGRVSRNAAKEALALAFETGKSPVAIVRERGLEQVSDAAQLERWVDEVLAAHPQEVADYRGGNLKVLGWFVGQVMAQSRGKADPKAVRALLERKLAA